MMTGFPIITIDGPSGSGKGTLCKAMAKVLQWNFLDSGAIYRVLALAALYHHIDVTAEEPLVSLATTLNVSFISIKDNLEVTLEGKNVSRKIRTQEVANIASLIASFPQVRKALLHYQRTFSRLPGLIADGRDMGTVVFPNAPVKIFLISSPGRRAYYRMLQLKKKGFSVNFERILFEIQERDSRDENRTVAPLIPAKDALVLDSTNLTIEQLIKNALQYTYKKLTFV